VSIRKDEFQTVPDEQGHFGPYGGRFVSETLMSALDELSALYGKLSQDANFVEEFDYDLAHYVGRPSPLYFAERLSQHVGGAQIYLKREDLGQHGVASATVAARLGLECCVYMGAEDVQRQKLNVYRMKLLGAEVIPVTSGSKTLKDAMNEAMRDWVTNVDNTYYIIGTVAGPHPVTGSRQAAMLPPYALVVQVCCTVIVRI